MTLKRVTYKNLDKNYSFQYSHFLPYDEAFWILTNVNNSKSLNMWRYR